MAERLSAELSLDISAFSAALQQAGQRVQQFASTVASQMASATASLATNTTATQQNAAANNALLVAMQNLQGTARQQVTVLQQISTQIDQVSTAARNATHATSTWTQALSVAAGLGITTSIQGIVSGLKNMATESVQLAVKMQSLNAAFRAITGSTAAASKELAFIRDVATKTGTDFFTLANSFKNFESASKGTSLEGEKAKMVFEGLATASRVMGLSTEQTSHALLALEQMVSKGRVSMEELRRQLGNALPGGFQIAARAMGATTDELNKMVKEGLNAEEFVVRFGRQLQKEFGPNLAAAADTAAATFKRLGNEVQALGVQTGTALLAMFQPIASFIERTLRSIREAGTEAQRAQSQLSAEVLAGKPILGHTGTTLALEPGATGAEEKTGLDLLDRIALLRKRIPEQETLGRLDFWSAGSKKALAEAEESYKKLNEQIRARNALLKEQERDPFEAGAVAGAAARDAMAKRTKDVASATADARKEMSNLGTTLKELGTAGATFPALIAGKEGQLDQARDKVREIDKTIGKVSESLQAMRKVGATPDAALQTQLTTLNAQRASAQAAVEGIEDTIAAQRKAESEGKRMARQAEADAKRLAQERIAITQDMTEQVAGMEQGAFAQKKLALDAYLADARKASVDVTLMAEFESHMLIKYAVEATRGIGDEFRKRVADATAAMKAESAQIDTERKALANLRTLSEADDPIERQRLAGLQRVNEYRLALQNSMIITSTQKEQALADATTAINQKALDDRQKQQEEAAQKALRPWRQLAEDVQRTLSDAFENVLSGTFSVWDGIKKGFIKLLADLAAAALTQQIIIPLAMGVMGASGGLIGAFTGAGGPSGLGGLAGSATGASGGLGGTTSDTGSGAFGTALSMASSGASLYSGISGNSLLGSNALTSGIMNTQLSSIFGGGAAAAAPTAASFFGGGTAAAGAYATGADAGLVGAATPASAMGATVGTVAGGVGVGIAAGQIFAKLNAMMGLHGTGNKVLSGAGGGAIAGAMIGSAVPIIGTAIGAIAGALIGALGGYVSSLFGPGKPEPEFQARSVQAAQVGYSPLTGLQLTSQFQILQDTHKDVGTLDAWRQTFKAINDSLTDMAGQVVSQFQGVAPELQQALVGPLNNAFTDIAQKITGLKIAGDDAEEFAKNLQDMMGTTLPGYFTDAMQGVVAQLNGAMKKIEPVFNAFNTVIDTLQKDIDALHSQQIQMRVTLDTARNALRTELQSPAEAFMTAQGQYARAKAAFEGGNAQQQIVMAPTLAQAAQALLSMSKSNDVLGQDPQLVRNLQSGLLSDLDMLQVQTDKGFETMTASIQDLISQAEAQKKLLMSGLSNPQGVDAIIETSMSALTYIQDLIAANAGEQDPLVQAQVSLLGGLTTIGTAQLQTLQDISSKLGGGVAGFAEGTPYISHSQLAYLHRGEAVVRAGDTYGGATINLSVNVSGEATTQGASQIADAVIREIERRSSRIGTTSIQTKR